MTNEHIDRFQVIIGPEYIDPYQHVNHAAWDRYFESARIQAATALNATISGTPATDTFLRRLTIKFKGQLKENDEVDITTTKTWQSCGVTFNQKMTRGKDVIGEVVATYCDVRSCSGGILVSFDRPSAELPLQLDDEFLLRGRKLHHLAAPAYFERERLRFLLSRGLTMENLIERGILVMVHSMGVVYGCEMLAGQKVNIRTNVDVHYTGVKVTFNQQMIKGDRVINEAETVYVPVAINDGRATIIRPPDDLRYLLLGGPIKDVPYSKDIRWL